MAEILPAAAPELTIERLFASPSLSGPSPRGVAFSPDGARVTFLKAREEDASRFDLWQFDVATGEQSMLVDSMLLEPEEVELSEEEKALRERRRIAGSRGIVSYDWGTADTILVPLGGDLWLVTLDEGEPQVRQLTQTEAFEYDAKVSPGGRYVSFVRDGAVYAIALASGEETRLTPLAEPENAIAYGVAEFVAQEEMSRYTGYWWSPDERYLAYTRVDESTVDVIPRFDIAAEGTTVIEQRYPRAGRPNAVVDLFVRDMETGEAIRAAWRKPEGRPDYELPTDQYLARIGWFSVPGGANVLAVQRVNRDQTEIEYLVSSFDSAAGLDGFAELYPSDNERQPNWINLSHDYRRTHALELATNEEQGFRHIAYRTDGSEGPAFWLTAGEWAVDTIVGVAGDGSRVFFTGYKDSPLERHLYVTEVDGGDPDNLVVTYVDGETFRTPLGGSEPVRLTPLGSSWSVTLSPDGRSFVGTSSSPDQPPQTGLYRLLTHEEKLDRHRAAGGGGQISDRSGCEDLVPGAAALQIYCGPQYELIAWIEENALDERHPYFPYLGDHTVPEFGTLTAEDGQTLYYSIHTPPDFDPARQYPVIVEVYGGPGVQTVTRDWERLTDQFYARQGYIVFRLDNRGSSNRGKAFEDVIYRQTGGPEVRDQLLGVEWLKSQPFVDPDRIAIQGWSYGGYMTLMTLLQAEPGTFAAAVSGAPVTDWSLYDTFYTERYMDTPQDNPDGYERSSVFYHLERFEGELPPLLLIHGMADDNVTFDNTTRLMAALQEQGRVFDLMTYPGQRHGIRGEALQGHLMRTRMAFLARHLGEGG